MLPKYESGPNGVRADNQQFVKNDSTNGTPMEQIHEAARRITLEPFVDIKDQDADELVELVAIQLHRWRVEDLNRDDQFQLLEPLIDDVGQDQLVDVLSEVDHFFATRFNAWLYGVDLDDV